MDFLPDFVETYPLFSILAVLFGIMILWAILNKLIKAAVILFIGIIIYAGYMNYAGRPVPHNSGKIIQQGKEQVETLKNFGIDFLKDFIITSFTEKKITMSDKNKAADSSTEITQHQNTP